MTDKEEVLNFESGTRRMIARANIDEMHNFLREYNELEPCCEIKNPDTKCEFALLRACLAELRQKNQKLL